MRWRQNRALFPFPFAFCLRIFPGVRNVQDHSAQVCKPKCSRFFLNDRDSIFHHIWHKTSFCIGSAPLATCRFQDAVIEIDLTVQPRRVAPFLGGEPTNASSEMTLLGTCTHTSTQWHTSTMANTMAYKHYGIQGCWEICRVCISFSISGCPKKVSPF